MVCQCNYITSVATVETSVEKDKSNIRRLRRCKKQKPRETRLEYVSRFRGKQSKIAGTRFKSQTNSKSSEFPKRDKHFN